MRYLPFFLVLACQSPQAMLEQFDGASHAAESGDDTTPLTLPVFRVYSPDQLADVDPNAMLDALAESPLVFFGERHATEPVQALEAWMLDALQRRRAFSLAMEHFDRDVQPVLDGYLAGTLDRAAFLAQSRPWPSFSHYWMPLVDRMKAAGLPVLALNVPKPSLSAIYAQFPTWPLDAVAPSPFLPSLPLPAWTPRYAAHFRDDFDYEAHQLGLPYDDALRYFTELAHLRDETMAEPLTRASTFVVQGEWHVQGGIATPSHVRQAYKIVTTLPENEASSFVAAGRWVSDYVLIYR